MSIFKAYDVRGVVPETLDSDVAYRFGLAAAQYFGEKEIVVGRDMRVSGDEIFAALVKGLTACGSNVVDIGLVDSPQVYFVVGNEGYRAGIMITASHNPPEYNGFKLCRQEAIPISYDTGLNEIEEIFNANPQAMADCTGTVSERDYTEAYIKYLHGFVSGEIKPLRVIADAGNGMAGKFLESVLQPYPVDLTVLYPELDGSFPNHEANPMKPENVETLRQRVLAEKADLGVAFDGDADRVVFIDNAGEIIASDMITIPIAQTFLKQHPGAAILYDLRSSWAVKEEIEAAGGRPVMSRVGHSFIKQMLRDEDGIFAGELSGHYYFKENYFADSGFIAMLKIIQLLSEEQKPLADIIKPALRYSASGEINSRVNDVDETLAKIEKEYAGYQQFHLDGLSVEGHDWWFNLRPSNTEPVLRLNLEAKNGPLMEKIRDEVLALIRG